MISLLYPPACLLCHRPVAGAQTLFCDACDAGLAVCQPPLCQRCGVGLSGAYDAQLWCPRCLKRPLAFDRARAPFRYVGRVREAIHAFKYEGRWRIGEWLARAMARTAAEGLPLASIEAIVPVPMHWVKRRLRGANPAAFLANRLAQLLKLRDDDGALARTRWTPTQTRLGPAQRFRNVQGAFRVRRRARRTGAVLLVDDVLTSGATAHACAAALREAGIPHVFVLTAACTPIPR